MVGHQVVRELVLAGHYVVALMRRADVSLEIRNSFLCDCELVPGVEVMDIDAVERAIRTARPDWIVNAAGLIKQRPGSSDQFRKVNSEFPHQLERLAQKNNSRIVQISTDCVFSGTRGNYSIADPVDPCDIYGVSKHAGELCSPNVTFRVSIVGRELFGALGLLEWFLAQEGKAYGHQNAFFTGVTTPVLGRAIERAISSDLEGATYHLPGPKISKASLLRVFREAFKVDTIIEDSLEPCIDRSLVGEWPAPLGNPLDWPTMVDELVLVNESYERVRSTQFINVKKDLL